MQVIEVKIERIFFLFEGFELNGESVREFVQMFVSKGSCISVRYLKIIAKSMDNSSLRFILFYFFICGKLFL